MNLSKAFDCILYDLLIKKMHLTIFERTPSYSFIYFEERRKQNVRINNTHSIFQVLLTGVPQ